MKGKHDHDCTVRTGALDLCALSKQVKSHWTPLDNRPHTMANRSIGHLTENVIQIHFIIPFLPKERKSFEILSALHRGRVSCLQRDEREREGNFWFFFSFIFNEIEILIQTNCDGAMAPTHARTLQYYVTRLVCYWRFETQLRVWGDYCRTGTTNPRWGNKNKDLALAYPTLFTVSPPHFYS